MKIHQHDGTTSSMINIIKDAQLDVVFHLASLFLAQHTSEDIEKFVQSNLLFGTQLVEAMTLQSVTKTSETVKEFSRTMDGLMKSDNKEKDPAHPLLAVFQPYLQKDNATLEKEVPDYYNKIQKSSISKTVKTSLSDVFTSWMLIRFQDKSYQEVSWPF